MKRISLNNFTSDIDEDLPYLVKNAVDSDILVSAVAFQAFRSMLYKFPDDEKVIQACKSYVELVENGKLEKKNPSKIAWCETIIKGLSDALNGEWRNINFPSNKLQDIQSYDGPLKSYMMIRLFCSENK